MKSYGGYTTNLPLEDLPDGKPIVTSTTANRSRRHMEDQPDCSFRTPILEALADPLPDLFAVDLTAVSVTCAACGKRQPLMAFDVYAGGARGDCSLSQLPGSHAAEWAVESDALLD